MVFSTMGGLSFGLRVVAGAAAMLLARSGEFNMSAGRVVVAVFCASVIASTAAADEIHRWRDDDGTLHVEITGSGDPVDADAEGHPLLATSEMTEEEKFSVGASRRRREIERDLTALGRELRMVQEGIAETDSERFVAYAPALDEDVTNPQFVLDAQRNAFLAAEKFRRDRSERLRRLRRDERDLLRAIGERWAGLEELRADVRNRYGTFPPWWRDRLDCGGCPSAADVERALAKKGQGKKEKALPEPRPET
ncbi:MAG: hypothetical protein ACREQY_14865 [Candidatus Binatia bacterium]